MAPTAMTLPPWYRQLWPWLLMLMPAIALFGGLATFWLAATTSDPLVVDDYYREGKAINRQLARDDMAGRLGLNAALERPPDGGARLSLTASAGGTLPAELTLRVVHATRAELDQVHRLIAIGAGLYRAADGDLPRSGRWNLLIEDPARSWRLTATATRFDEPIRFRSQSPSPESARPGAQGGDR